MTRKELLEIAKPILFNTEMVQAILDDEKTTTRRIIKSPDYYVFTGKTYSLVAGKQGQEYLYAECIKQSNGAAQSVKCPYRVNDILYVRETWNFVDCENCIQEICFPKLGMNGCYIYRAYYDDTKKEEMLKWRPSIHMPKEAARIFLKVIDIRMERLRDIKEEQAKAEGIKGYSKDGKLYKYAVNDEWWIRYHKKHKKDFTGTYWQDMPRTGKEAFSYLWNSTIKKKQLDQYGWDANPWVWVIEFEKCEKPEG